MNEGAALATLLWVAVVSGSAPLLAGLFRGYLPQVVLLLAGGVLIGPQALGLAAPQDIEVLAEVGLGFLFLLAGYELEPRLLVHNPLTHRALFAWFASVGLAFAIVGVLAAIGFVEAYVAVALALTTTALGVLLPLLRERSLTGGVYGQSILCSGAVAEVLPVLAIAVFLGARGQFVAILSLAAVALLAAALVVIPRRLRGSWVDTTFHANLDDTAQASVRATVLLLVFFLWVAFDFGLDVVLGAFLAGVVLRTLGPADAVALEHKLDVIGYGFFIPVFFVSSGMALDIDSIAEAPLRLPVFFVLLLVVRGLPTFLAYRGRLSTRERVEVGLLAATALPLLVAITHLAQENGTMLTENAAALVGAGALSVLVFPAVALASHDRGRSKADDSVASAPG